MVKHMSFSSLEEIDASLYDFKILFAYHSNKIENERIDFHDTRDIFEKGSVNGYTGDLRTLYEIENQVHCYNYLKPLIVEKKALDISFVKCIHYKLMKGTYDDIRYHDKQERPGEFKKHDYVTGKNEIGSYPHEVESDVKELLSELNTYQGTDYFTAGVYLHAMFEHIHPFADGNGRAGRTLMNYYFMIHDIAPVIIYNEDKPAYYFALEAFDHKDSDLTPLKSFIQEEQAKTWCKKKGTGKKRLREFLE